MDNNLILRLTEGDLNSSNIDRLVNIYHCLSQILVFDVPGSVVELGCHKGKTSIFLQMIIDYFDPERDFHVYDSFQGLPPKSVHDQFMNERKYQAIEEKFDSGAYICGLPSFANTFKEQGLKATKQQFEEHFRQWNLKMPMVHEGWFEETLLYYLPETIAFAFLDGDFYNSIHIGLRYIYPRLSPKSIVIVDDYCDIEKNPYAWPGLPGVKKACDAFFEDKPEKVNVLIGSDELAMGYFRKL